jgi:hypothetical protein
MRCRPWVHCVVAVMARAEEWIEWNNASLPQCDREA